MKPTILILALAAVLLPLGASAKDSPPDIFCDGKAYFPRGDREPHIHCGSSFAKLTGVGHHHKSLADGNGVFCDRIGEGIAEMKGVTTEIGFAVLERLRNVYRTQDCRKELAAEKAKK